MKMHFEQPHISNRESLQEKSEVYEPEILPITDMGNVYSNTEDGYIPKHSEQMEKAFSKYFDSVTVKYALISEIAGMEYLFILSGQKGEAMFGFSFKTLSYGYAVTNLDRESTQKLSHTIANFLETVYYDSKEQIILISTSPADSSYTVREIEDCIETILKQSGDSYTEDELRTHYKGNNIFDLYENLTGNDYHSAHYNTVSKANARSRYFKMNFKKYLKNWEIMEDALSSTRFYLKRKGVTLEEEK